VIDTADMPTENGTALHAGRTPSRDAAVVRMLRAAGAVILGKTVSTECAYFHPGKTRNPHNLEHTPGGSSSGSAAAVSAGMVPLALGTQTNGSVIRPAAFCGVYGFKPSHGLVPRSGILPLSRTVDHVGVFARSIEDVALALESLAGWDEGDPDTRLEGRVRYAAIAAEEPPIAPVIGLLKTPHWDRLEPEAREAFAELVTSLGDAVEELELPSITDAWKWHRIIMEAEMAANFGRIFGAGCDQFSEKLRGLIGRGREYSAVEYQDAIAGIAPLREGFEELFTQRYDAIITPAATGPAPKGLESTGDPVFCSLMSLTGQPALSMPLLTSSNGMPIGVQLVGRRHFDARLLRTARWLVARLSAG
jgi:Asp-tRNA(Asn)/Glu-tRNA(Gln) amidotransferase A subunit family amidase